MRGRNREDLVAGRLYVQLYTRQMPLGVREAEADAAVSREPANGANRNRNSSTGSTVPRFRSAAVPIVRSAVEPWYSHQNKTVEPWNSGTVELYVRIYFAASMPLSPGMTLGSFEILAPLGAGGMGEVYRARDTRLDRDVALRFCPRPSRAIPIAWRASSAKPARSPRSIIRTSRRCTASRRRGEHPRAGHGAGRGRGPRAAHRARARCRSTKRCRSRGRSPRRSRPRTSRHHPSRSQARQHQGARRRHGEGARLRSGQGARARDRDRGVRRSGSSRIRRPSPRPRR